MKRICLLLLIAAPAAYAGGFPLTVDAAGKSTDPKAKGAFLTARLTGCHEDEKGTINVEHNGDGARLRSSRHQLHASPHARPIRVFHTRLQWISPV